MELRLKTWELICVIVQVLKTKLILEKNMNMLFESKFQDSKKLKEKGMRKRRHKKQNHWLSHKRKHPFLLFLRYTFLEVIEELYTIYSEEGEGEVFICRFLYPIIQSLPDKASTLPRFRMVPVSPNHCCRSLGPAQ